MWIITPEGRGINTHYLRQMYLTLDERGGTCQGSLLADLPGENPLRLVQLAGPERSEVKDRLAGWLTHILSEMAAGRAVLPLTIAEDTLAPGIAQHFADSAAEWRHISRNFLNSGE